MNAREIVQRAVSTLPIWCEVRDWLERDAWGDWERTVRVDLDRLLARRGIVSEDDAQDMSERLAVQARMEFSGWGLGIGRGPVPELSQPAARVWGEPWRRL